MSEEKKQTYVPHSEFLEKASKKKDNIKSANNKIPQEAKEYAEDILNVADSDAFQSFLKKENELIGDIIMKPFREPVMMPDIAKGMSWAEKMAFNAGMLEGLRRVKVVREQVLLQYQQSFEEK